MVNLGVKTDGCHVPLGISLWQSGTKMLNHLCKNSQNNKAINISFFCPLFVLRKLQRETPEKDRQPDPKLPEPVRCRWPSHIVYCKKGNKDP